MGFKNPKPAGFMAVWGFIGLIVGVLEKNCKMLSDKYWTRK